MSRDETIDYILANNVSLTRFGDGELLWMINENSYYFQKNNVLLANRLKEILKKDNPRILIAIPPQLTISGWMKATAHSKRFFIFWIGTKYKKIYRFLNLHYHYGNTTMTRFYIDSKNKKNIQKTIDKLKLIWEGRSLLFVEGWSTRLGVKNDLFDNAKGIKRVICPNKNAFDYYDIIINEIVKKYKSNDLVVLSLGPTATVMAYDLEIKFNIQALDIGHIDSEYYWYKIRAKKRVAIPHKHTAEINNDDFIEEPVDEEFNEYKKQIVAIVKSNN